MCHKHISDTSISAAYVFVIARKFRTWNFKLCLLFNLFDLSIFRKKNQQCGTFFFGKKILVKPLTSLALNIYLYKIGFLVNQLTWHGLQSCQLDTD